MAVDITHEVDVLRTATYGEEVRGSIGDALLKLQNGVNQASGGSNTILRVKTISPVFPKNNPIGIVGTVETEE